jgi:hypothetical protein
LRSCRSSFFPTLTVTQLGELFSLHMGDDCSNEPSQW